MLTSCIYMYFNIYTKIIYTVYNIERYLYFFTFGITSSLTLFQWARKTPQIWWQYNNKNNNKQTNKKSPGVYTWKCYFSTQNRVVRRWTGVHPEITSVRFQNYFSLSSHKYQRQKLDVSRRSEKKGEKD